MLNSINPHDQNTVHSWWSGSNKTPSKPDVAEFRFSNGKWCQGQKSAIEGGTLGVFIDITERKMLLDCALKSEVAARAEAEEAEKRRKDAEESRRGQELLIDVTSHELRQPVSAILNSASLIRDNLCSLQNTLANSQGMFEVTPEILKIMQEDLEALDAIYQCALTQERIANDVLSLSRIQLGLLNIHTTEFNLFDEIARIISLFRTEAHMKQIRIEPTFGISFRTLGIDVISTDRTRLSQVVTNLLSNAIKFTTMALPPQRRIAISIDMALFPPLDNSCRLPALENLPVRTRIFPNEPIFLYISVTDSGPGLSSEDLALLFQRFQQGSNSHHVFGGSGLGLFVSRNICELLGGRIEVSSTLGQGATFRFFIQAAAASSPPKVDSLVSPKALDKDSHLHPCRILIAEDNPINQTILKRQLLNAGHIVDLANNGKEAIEKICASDRPFDAILMDIEMPVLDGLSAVREIRRLELAHKLPRRHRIIALTGNAREGQVQTIRQAGMDEVMIKPYKLEDILANLRSSSS